MGHQEHISNPREFFAMASASRKALRSPRHERAAHLHIVRLALTRYHSDVTIRSSICEAGAELKPLGKVYTSGHGVLP